MHENYRWRGCLHLNIRGTLVYIYIKNSIMYSFTSSLPSLTMVFIDQMAYDQFGLLRKFRDMEQGYNK